jgi:hypothetical protein
MKRQGETFRNVLTALKEASGNSTVFYVSDSKSHLREAIQMAKTILLGCVSRKRWRHYVTGEKIVIVNAGSIHFMTRDNEIYDRIVGYQRPIYLVQDGD